LNEYIKWNFRG